MGVSQYTYNTYPPSSTPGVNSISNTDNDYNSNDDNNYGDTSSSILTEYLETGLTNAFLQKYNRELTVAASGLSVIILIVLGFCVWCLIGVYRKGLEEDDDKRTQGKSGGGGSDELDSSYCASEGSAFNHSAIYVAKEGDVTKTKKGLISKFFGKDRKNGKRSDALSRIYAQHHRNIITPDKTIPFIVPTVRHFPQNCGRYVEL